MEIRLRKLEANEPTSVFEMFRDIPSQENGFGNSFHGCTREIFDKKVREHVLEADRKEIINGRVPQTYYISFIEDDIPVGFVKLRHILTPELLERGGHIGYCIALKFRGKGYAKKQLVEALKEAKKIGIDKVLITCDEENWPSRRTIVGALNEYGGKEDEKLKMDNGVYKLRFWINT